MPVIVNAPVGFQPVKGFSRSESIVLLFASVIFVISIVSPPHLMDDVDSAHAQMAHNILQSGDWVTMRLDGVKDFEKPPVEYWLIAISYQIFGVHDWSARVPNALAGILLCWLVARMARRAMGEEAGLYAGLSLATCAGLWLFTRVLMPDVVLTLSVGFALWSFMRALDSDETHWRAWALASWAAIGAGILLKGLIAAVFPVATALLYLLFTGLWRESGTWRRLSVLPGFAVLLAIAAPWHILATLRNPPYLDFTIHSPPGVYRGFFWFHFVNEHLLRFFNLRYPHDYDTVPKTLFWALHFVWFFPWSAFLIRAIGLDYRGSDRASRMRLLSLCWIGAVLGFFTLSTRQEYYSMPAYPAFAILIGSAMAASGKRGWRWATRVASVAVGCAFLAIAGLLWVSRSYAAPGDISRALTSHPENYTLSLGHMGDLTVQSFAYLRLPLAIAGLATLIGAIGAWVFRGRRAAFALAIMMVLFFQAARVALIAFDPYLGSYPLAEALNRSPEGGLIIDDPYFEMSSILYYANRTALILNNRRNNLEYGSYAPGAPQVFIGDAEFLERWKSPQRWYVASEDENAGRLRDLAGPATLHAVASAGRKNPLLESIVSGSAPLRDLRPEVSAVTCRIPVLIDSR